MKREIMKREVEKNKYENHLQHHRRPKHNARL